MYVTVSAITWRIVCELLGMLETSVKGSKNQVKRDIINNSVVQIPGKPGHYQLVLDNPVLEVAQLTFSHPHACALFPKQFRRCRYGAHFVQPYSPLRLFNSGAPVSLN